MTEQRDVLRERQLISKHRLLLEAHWRAHGRVPHTWVAIDAATGRITPEPDEMPPTPSAVVRMERISRQVCHLRRVEAIERSETESPLLSVSDEASLSHLPEETIVTQTPAQSQLALVEPASPRPVGRRGKADPSARVAYRKLSRMDNVRIHQVLSRVLEEHPEQKGRFRYLGAASDDSVAQEAIPDYPGQGRVMVGECRREMFGPYPTTGRVRPVLVSDEDLQARVGRLERIVEYLCEQLCINPDEIKS